MFLLQPGVPLCPLHLPRRGSCPGRRLTGEPLPAGAPAGSLRCAPTFRRTRAAVGFGAAGRRARCSAASNKWSDYPMTSLSTSVRQKDMARREISGSHEATATRGMVSTAGEEEEGGAHSAARTSSPKLKRTHLRYPEENQCIFCQHYSVTLEC